MPDVSLIIPTFERAAILAETLARIPAGDYEIIVCDNGSMDSTAGEVRAAMQKDTRIRYLCSETNDGTFQNTLRGFSAATTDLVVYHPDDDSILAEPLLEHIARMKAEPDLVAIFTDSIAWDDSAPEPVGDEPDKREMHRYYPQGIEAKTFGPEDNTNIADFLLATFIPPEIGIFRKDAAIKARTPVAKAQPYHIWAYNFSRLGKIRFDPLAFLREHRVLKTHLHREHWGNMDGAWAYIGDEQRLGLMSMYQQALMDRGVRQMNDLHRLSVHDKIETMLTNRVSLEIRRAMEREDFILAVELRRWQALWHLTESKDEDYAQLTLPAAAQAAKMCGVEAETMVEAYRIG